MKTVLSVMIALCLAPAAAQPPRTTSLVGAWRITEIVQPDGRKVTNVPPSLYVFTERHYSAMEITGPRPKTQFGETMSDADKIATFDNFNANSGTYEVKGDTLTIRPMVAKNEFIMSEGFFIQWRFTIAGQALTLTQTSGVFAGRVTKFTRLE